MTLITPHLSLPSGLIALWKGTVAAIPPGWALCDGANGTPDLRDKFIVGAKQDDAGMAKSQVSGVLQQTGGSAYMVSGSEVASTGDPDNFGSDNLPPFFALAYIMKL